MDHDLSVSICTSFVAPLMQPEAQTLDQLTSEINKGKTSNGVEQTLKRAFPNDFGMDGTLKKRSVPSCSWKVEPAKLKSHHLNKREMKSLRKEIV